MLDIGSSPVTGCRLLMRCRERASCTQRVKWVVGKTKVVATKRKQSALEPGRLRWQLQQPYSCNASRPSLRRKRRGLPRGVWLERESKKGTEEKENERNERNLTS